MRILTALTYYTPHISGLTIYARRLLRRLAAKGHTVTVLTSHFSHELPRREELDGTTVIRTRMMTRISKGAVMPFLPWHALRLAAAHDLVYLHLPQFEAVVIALAAKLARKPIVVSYQCDIVLPSRRARFVFAKLIDWSHGLTCALADTIVTTSEDFAAHSAMLGRFRHKVLAVTPPIEIGADGVGPAELRRRFDLGDGPLVGFVGRFAEEKGIEYLVESVPLVLRELPDARYVMVGLTDQVFGERVHERVWPKIEALGPRIRHIGVLDDDDLRALYHAIDVLVLPSTNSTESFGMTQAEAMLAGTPVVTTDLPGVREAVRVSGMGRLVPPRDGPALADAIVAVLRDPASYSRPEEEVRELFDPQRTADFYEKLFRKLVGARGRASSDAEPRSGS